MRIAVLVVIAAGLAWLCPAAEDDADLLLNPGFEMDWDQDGFADDWRMLTQKGHPTGKGSTDRPKTGKACVFADTPSQDHVGYWSQIVTLKPGMKRFRLSASARTDGRAQANVSFTAYDAQTRKWLCADYSLIVVKGSADWQTHTKEFEVPEGAGTVRIALWCNYGRKGHGRVWFDDVTLRPVGYVREAPPENVAVNPGFEELPAPGRLPTTWHFARSKPEAKPLADCDSPRSGAVSPGVEVGPGGTGLLWQWAPMTPGWPTYQVSAWVKTEGGARALSSLSVYGLDKKKWIAAGYELFNIDTQGQWRQAVGYYPAPPTAGVLKVALWAKAGADAAGKAWFDDVVVRPVESVPATPYVPAHPAPAATAEDQARGFVVFRRDYVDLMPPSYRPSSAEIQRAFTMAAARGEYEPLSVGVYALDEVQDLRAEPIEFRSESGAQIGKENVEVSVVRCLVKRSHYALSDRVQVPVYLEKSDALTVRKGQVGQFWLTLHVPPDAAPGDYRGALRLVASSGREAARLPVSLRVYPFTLAEPRGMAFGMYDGLQRTIPGEDYMDKKYREMRTRGMTTVGFYGNLGATMHVDGDRAELRFEDKPGLHTAMDAYARADFPEPIVWLMGSDVRRFCAALGDVQSEAFGRAYKAIIAAVLAEGKRRGWPEIIFQPEDEVFAHAPRFEVAFRELKLLKELPGVRTEMDGTNVRPALSEQTYPFTDALVHCYGPMLYGKKVYPRPEWLGMVEQYHRDGKRIWFYNVDTTGYHVETMRFAAGLYMLWSNADGLLSWAFSSGDSKPYDDYSGPRGDTIFFYPPRSAGRGGPALGLEGLREGIDDFRYARTLRDRVAAARQSQDAKRRGLAEQAHKAVEAQLARLDLSRLRTNRSMQGNWTGHTTTDDGRPAVSGSFRLDVGISLGEYDGFRSTCARYIEQLGD